MGRFKKNEIRRAVLLDSIHINKSADNKQSYDTKNTVPTFTMPARNMKRSTTFWVRVCGTLVIFALVLSFTIVGCVSEAGAPKFSPACILVIIASVLTALISLYYVINACMGNKRRSQTVRSKIKRSGKRMQGVLVL